MQMRCPQCLSVLTALPGDQAACPACGEKCSVLFSRSPRHNTAPPMAIPLAAGENGVGSSHDDTAGMCSQHRTVPALAQCSRCGRLMCQTCAIAMADGTSACAECALAPTSAATLPGAQPAAGAWAPVATTPTGPATAPMGAKCQYHQSASAVHLCSECKAPICRTCVFEFSPAVHLCPTCATKPQKLSSKRKTAAIWSVALAAWSTVALVALFVWAAVLSEAEAEALGAAMGIISLLPALVGVGLGIGGIERRLSNPTLVWVGVIWSGAVVAVWILLILVGTFMG